MKIRSITRTASSAALPVLAALVLAVPAAAPDAEPPPSITHSRLPSDQLDVTPPSERVTGSLGEMRIVASACPALPEAETRRRIVDVAVQEWGFFGFPVMDLTVEPDESPEEWRRRVRSSGDPVEEARVAASIGGYWAATADGSWILDRQNNLWKRSDGRSLRWRYFWSAAFVSWVMCESGLGESSRFRRNIAHHVYIDQAIRARDRASSSAFIAYDPGEKPVEPGDMLCSSRRPVYRSLAERRRQMGNGASTHCDIVVKVDEANQRILTIGGNVRGRVSLKIMPAQQGAVVTPAARGSRPLFAHLKLQAAAIEPDALDHSPTIRAIGGFGAIPSSNPRTSD